MCEPPFSSLISLTAVGADSEGSRPLHSSESASPSSQLTHHPGQSSQGKSDLNFVSKMLNNTQFWADVAYSVTASQIRIDVWLLICLILRHKDLLDTDLLSAGSGCSVQHETMRETFISTDIKKRWLWFNIPEVKRSLVNAESFRHYEILCYNVIMH